MKKAIWLCRKLSVFVKFIVLIKGEEINRIPGLQIFQVFVFLLPYSTTQSKLKAIISILLLSFNGEMIFNGAPWTI